MRISKATFYCALLAAWSLQPLIAESISQPDREHLLAHLQMTASWLPGEVARLSTAQLNFRIAPGKWTVAEVVQHLVIAEPNYWKLFQDGMNRPAQVLKDKSSDADVLWYGIDRTRHDKTPAKQDPQGQKVNIGEALASYSRLHSVMLEYASKTNADLRAHAVPEMGG